MIALMIDYKKEDVFKEKMVMPLHIFLKKSQ